jgi:hypothetical protein
MFIDLFHWNGRKGSGKPNKHSEFAALHRWKTLGEQR